MDNWDSFAALAHYTQEFSGFDPQHKRVTRTMAKMNSVFCCPDFGKKTSPLADYRRF